MKKASIFISLFLISFLISTWSVGAQTAPIGYFQHGDFYCNGNPNFEKPDSALGKRFCQPQIAGCQTIGGKFCTAGTRNICCPADYACGKGTALKFWEVAVCVQPTTPVCQKNSPGYVGQTKDGQNVCCRSNQELAPAGGRDAPFCQPKNQSACASSEQFIQGTGANQNSKWCCPSNTNLAHHPNGAPFCAQLPLHVLAPNGGEQILKTGPFYQIRWETSFPDKIKLRIINARGAVVSEASHTNDGSDFFDFSSATYPPGQYKVELKATVDGKTFTDQSDNFFTIFDNTPLPLPPPDTTPPIIKWVYPFIGPATVNKSTVITIGATDYPSGIRSVSIGVKAPGMTNSLFKMCNRGACSLPVPANQWVVGTVIIITAMDNSPNPNIALETYIITGGQLQKQAKKNSDASKIIVPSKSQCHTFTTNLSFGMSGSEVTALQTALTRAGFPVNTTGIFDEATASAVSSFQLKYKSELLTANGLTYPTGYFGSATRQKLNRLWGCN